MAHVALGTDTGGSCRIPAAFTGLVGFKPTANRVPLEGCLPLSPSLDSIGSIARSVECCTTIDAIISSETQRITDNISLKGLHFAVPTNVVFEDIDPVVQASFQSGLDRLSEHGAIIENVTISEFDSIAGMNSKGGFAAAESFAFYHDLLSNRLQELDPRVAVRIRRGAEQSALDYIRLKAQRTKLITGVERAVSTYDALIMPTTPIVPPTLSSLDEDDAYGCANLLALRNCTIINLIDGCAISIPAPDRGDVPVGIMLAARHGFDQRLLAIARTVESVFLESD